jgi:hypothetical protein
MGLDTTNDPAAVMFHDRELCRASGAQLADARALYAILTGRVVAVHRPGDASIAETNKYSFLGTERNAGKMDLYFRVRAGHVAPHADRHAQRRRALGCPDEPFSPGQQHDERRRAWQTSAAFSGSRIRAGSTTHAIFTIPDRVAAKVPVFSQFSKRVARLQHRTGTNIAPNIGIAGGPQS